MFRSVKNIFGHYAASLSRRDLFRQGGLLAAAGALGRKAAQAEPPVAGALQLGPNIYQSIGVRPAINCRGTFTIIGGSLELPEVRAAKEAAAQNYVHLDELM